MCTDFLFFCKWFAQGFADNCANCFAFGAQTVLHTIAVKSAKGYITVQQLQCPAQVVTSSSNWWQYSPHYGVQEGLIKEGGGGDHKSGKLTSLKNASAKLLFTDTWASLASGGNNTAGGMWRWDRGQNLTNTAYGRPAARHSGAVNCLFADMRVESIKAVSVDNIFTTPIFNATVREGKDALYWNKKD